MFVIKAYKSEVVDTIIVLLEDKLKETGKHLLKTDTIFDRCSHHINLCGDSAEQNELLEIGMRQVIQSRLYTHGYFSVQTGYFVNVDACENLWYLKLIINGKDDVVKGKVAARNRLSELMAFDGQITMVPDDKSELQIVETRTKEEVIADLEADAI